MKKILAGALSCVALIAGSFAFVGCGGRDLPKYYGKTYTMTGKGLALDWDTKMFSDAVGELSGGDSNKIYSRRELLTKYWDRIAWSRSGIDREFSSIDDFIVYANNVVENAYDDYEGIAFSINKEGTVLTMTVPENGQRQEIVMTYDIVETKNEIEAEFNKMEEGLAKIDNPQAIPGRICYSFIDDDGNGLNDAYFEFSTSFAYNWGNEVTIRFNVPEKIDRHDGQGEHWENVSSSEPLGLMSGLEVITSEGEENGNHWTMSETVFSWTFAPQVVITNN